MNHPPTVENVSWWLRGLMATASVVWWPMPYCVGRSCVNGLGEGPLIREQKWLPGAGEVQMRTVGGEGGKRKEGDAVSV